MSKVIIQEGNYTFDASARTITVTGPNQALFNEESLLMISNATDGRVIYNPQYAHTTGTFASNVLTLSENTELMSDSDQLQIICYSNTEAATVADDANAISANAVNSRAAANMAALETFQGVGEDVSKWGRVGVSITSDNATDGVLTMEVSHDGVTWSGPTRTWANTAISQPHMWNIVEKYFRIKYVNGTTPATNLSIQTQYSSNADVFLAHQIDEVINDEIEGIVVRAVVAGKDEISGDYRNVEITAQNELLTNTLPSDRAVSASYNLSGILATTYAILIDLSDTVNFPHDQTGSLTIDMLIEDLELSSNSVGSVEVGVITRIDGTDADISYPLDTPFTSGTRRLTKEENYSPAGVSLLVEGGTTTKLITNDKESSIAAVNTGITLDSPNGAITPGLGDCIVKYTHTSGSAWESFITCLYHSDD